MARALIVIAMILISLVFSSGCSPNPGIDDAFNPGTFEELNYLKPPKEAPFDPTPEKINKSIEDFFS